MSGSRGPLSKPNAVRSPTPKAPEHELPAGGYAGEIPSWPFAEGSELELLLWEDLWRSPVAVEWAKAGVGVTRQVARLVRLSVLMEDLKNSVATGQTLSALLMLEKNLGIGPEAMKRLGLIIRDEEPVQSTAKVSSIRRFEIVDPEAS